MKTAGGNPKLDLVSFTYHHALATLIDRVALSKEIGIHKIVYEKVWGPGYSKGFFPAEMSFTERAIPELVAQGLEWVIVSNNHISRACKGYPFSPSGDNIDPPNAADALNPAQSLYFQMSISRGCVPNNAVPFAYVPHKAQHVDPVTGKVSKITVVPAEQAMGWQDGYECYGPGDIQKIASHSNSSQPMLILFAHDGDNDFGGGYTYYTQCIPNFVSQAQNLGYVGTSIQDYLDAFPVSDDDIVKVSKEQKDFWVWDWGLNLGLGFGI
jgi:hypothetical protein